MMNNNTLTTVNNKALFGLIFPLGISLTVAVLGFLLSIPLSTYLLKAIAADLAKIIHKIM